ncbi:MAG TPA: hypothetical protein ENN80_13545 [Candidatus Hydrogenedentes bacterium]|nr:hypothetical protein [Candidatus Hydrogenedentota bacterium]
MVLGLTTLVLVDVILFLLIRLVHAEWRKRDAPVPMTWAVGLFILSCVAHFGATKTLGRAVHSDRDALISLAASAACGFVPIWGYVHMLLGRVREHRQVRRVERWPHAKKRRLEGDVDGALREYVRYYDRQPDDPEPLFAAAEMLEGAAAYGKAATLYSQIMDRFDGDTAWARAARGLVAVREHHLHDPAGAEEIRAQIAARARY